MSQQPHASIALLGASHLQYHRWANHRIVEAAGALPSEALHKDHGVSFKSIFGTLVHMYQADSTWFGRIFGNPDSQTTSYPPKPDLAGLTSDCRGPATSSREPFPESAAAARRRSPPPSRVAGQAR